MLRYCQCLGLSPRLILARTVTEPVTRITGPGIELNQWRRGSSESLANADRDRPSLTQWRFLVAPSPGRMPAPWPGPVSTQPEAPGPRHVAATIVIGGTRVDSAATESPAELLAAQPCPDHWRPAAAALAGQSRCQPEGSIYSASLAASAGAAATDRQGTSNRDLNLTQAAAAHCDLHRPWQGPGCIAHGTTRLSRAPTSS